MTQYTVNVPLLNVRKRIPPVMPDKDGITGTVKQNYTFNGQQVPADQVSHLGMDKWYQDNNGHFYWGGGLAEQEPEITISAPGPPGVINYAQSLSLPNKVTSTLGHNIVVAVFDSGCNDHSALKGKIAAAYDAVTNTSAAMVTDASALGHGTFVAGLIAAGAIPGEKMQGMAPGVKLIIIKIIEDEDGLDNANVVKGLKWLRNECPVKPHIINMSLGCSPDDRQEIDGLIQGFASDGVILIAAGQNDTAAFSDAQIFYPACHEAVIGVGCVNASTMLAAVLSRQINYLTPNITFTSTGKFDDYAGTADYRGCSFSTALTSGLFALTLSYLQTVNDPSSPDELVSQMLKNFDPNHFSNSLNLYKNETTP